MANEGNNLENVIDIDKWTTSLERLLEDVPQYMCIPGHPGRISRIPENLREVDTKAYQPCFVSIGPYHHGKPWLEHMEKRKRFVLKCVLEISPDLTLRDYLRAIASIEKEVRSFYTDLEMESEKLIHMLLVDSVYMVTLFCGIATHFPNVRAGSTADTESVDETANKKSERIDSEDHNNDNSQMIENDDKSIYQMKSSGDRWFRNLFARDLFLIENQLPFFVIEKTYELIFGGTKSQLIDIMKVKVANMLSNYPKLECMVISQTEEVHHLLHLCHMFFRPTIQQEDITCQLHQSGQMFRLGNAVQLYESGVRFKLQSNSTEHSLLDISFDVSGTLAMPCLNVDDNTVSLLRNLIALEQMKYPSLGLDVSAYAVLLLHLVTIPEDVALLRRKRIIQHHLASDKEMMCIINQLSVGLAFDYVEDKYNLKPIFQELKRYTEHRVPRWRAWLRHRYFSNPWMVITLLAASFLLLLSVLQTFYTVYSYYNPYLERHL